MEIWLSPLFLGELEPTLRFRFEGVAEAVLDTLLDTALRDGKEAWPGIDVDAARYVQHLAAMLEDGDAAPTDALAALHSSDLYLSCACLDRNALALRTLENDFIAKLAPALRSTGLDAAGTDDVIQKVRELVFVGNDGVPGIANYRGRGQLRSWLRAVALRNAMMEFRGQKARPVATDDDALAALAVSEDVQFAPWKQHYASAFRAAFAQTIAGLDDHQRTLLRQHHLDRLTVDDLARLNQVHRATAARWVASAREKLLAGIRKHMMNELAISGGELDSALRLARSQLDVSIHRMFDAKRKR